MEFNLSESLTTFQDADKSSFSVSNEDLLLLKVTDALAVSPESIGNEDVFDSMQDLVHSYPKLSKRTQKALGYLVSSSSLNLAQITIHLIDSGENESFPIYRRYLELFGYLNYCYLDHLREEDHSAMGNRSKKQIDRKLLENFETNCQQVEAEMESISKILQIKLSKLFLTTPERDLFVSLFTRPIWGLMENKERMKIQGVKVLMFKCICEAVKFHGHASVAQSSIISNLTFFEHLNTPLAELLASLLDTYDYPQLTDEVLRELSNKDFDPNDTTGPKSVATFLSKLSELQPRIVMKQMTLIAQFLDNSSSSLRCAVIEVCGNIIANMCNEDELFEMHKNNLDKLIALLEQRLLDQSHYARARSLRSMISLCDSKRSTLKRHRVVFTELAVRSLEDKSSHVRRYAIKLLSKLILTHPFSLMHGSQLNLTVWKKRLLEAEHELEKLDPTYKAIKLSLELQAANDDGDEMDVDSENELEVPLEEEKEEEEEEEVGNISVINDEPIHKDQETLNNIAKLKLTIQYYIEAIEFIQQVGKGVRLGSQLLYSKNKSDVIETMDFFVIADAFDVEGKDQGIRRMLHLVWMKNGNDEGDNIPKKLVECYSQFYLTAPNNISAEQAAAYVAKNLCKLTFESSVAELASLEKLVGMLYEEKLINELIVKVLWQIYSYDPSEAQTTSIEQQNQQRLGSIIILGMIGLANNEEVLKGLDLLLNIGLGESGREDLIFQKYSCIALQRIVPSVKLQTADKDQRFKVLREEEVIEKLSEAALYYTEDNEWYGVAEEVINAIYIIADHPDRVCTEIIKSKTQSVFEVSDDTKSDVIELSQVLFIVGHVAIKTLVYLEKLEAEFKNKKHLAEQNKSKDKDSEHQNELEMIGGTSEDDFADAVHVIKEQELLFSEQSILSRFKDVVKVIASNNMQYDDPILQRSATLCLSKLMLVSSKYCEENLPLLITIMEKSPDPIIRSNAVLALGDMAVVFNNLVDANTDYLYRRLNDDNIMVQRTCLMTITFLILAGQVKVKGQLSQMAKCLEHKDQGISDMCKMFFTELATKDNAIYNSFIDLFSGLSNDDDLQEPQFHRIVKFVIGFIDSDKHINQLTGKLLQRLANSKNEREWNNVAFVLNTLPIKDELLEEVKTVIDGGFRLVSANS